MTLWTSEVLISNLSYDLLTKRSCALAQLAWNAFILGRAGLAYPSIVSHKLNKSSMEFARGLSPCSARFGNLYFYVVPVTVTRAHIHGDACATRCRPVFFFFSFFFVPPDRDLRDILFIQIFCSLSSELAEGATRTNPITRDYSYWQTIWHAASTITWSSARQWYNESLTFH